MKLKNEDIAGIGCQLIAEERRRQIEKEGWSPEHDDKHDCFEILHGAITYARAAKLVARSEPTGPVKSYLLRSEAGVPGWAWSPDWLKISDDPIRNLVKAGALIAAEIDRLTRAAEKAKK